MLALLGMGYIFLFVGLLLFGIFAILSLTTAKKQGLGFLISWGLMSANIGVMMAGLVLVIVYLLN